MVDVYEVSAVLAAVGVLIGVVYYILDIRHQNRERQTALVMDLYSTFSNKEFQIALTQTRNIKFRDTDDFMNKYGPQVNVEFWAGWQSIAAFFEQVGVLLHRKLIDISLVDDLLSGPIRVQWEIMAPIIREYRKRLGAPNAWEWFEYLYNEMKKREQRLQV